MYLIYLVVVLCQQAKNFSLYYNGNNYGVLQTVILELNIFKYLSLMAI